MLKVDILADPGIKEGARFGKQEVLVFCRKPRDYKQVSNVKEDSESGKSEKGAVY